MITCDHLGIYLTRACLSIFNHFYAVLNFMLTLNGSKILFSIIESVDSISRDGPDMPYM